jgi:hypothetical protein
MLSTDTYLWHPVPSDHTCASRSTKPPEDLLLPCLDQPLNTFLDATDIGLRVNNNEREEEEAHNQDSWDLESLNSSISSIESS